MVTKNTKICDYLYDNGESGIYDWVNDVFYDDGVKFYTSCTFGELWQDWSKRVIDCFNDGYYGNMTSCSDKISDYLYKKYFLNDSGIREKLFNGLCEMLNVDYGDVYNLWLHCDTSIFDKISLHESKNKRMCNNSMRSRRRRFESYDYDYNDFSMNLYQEYNIDDIRKALWSGGADRAECLSDEQLAEILSMAFGDRDFVDLTEVNDFVWFSDNIYYVWLGYDSVDEMWKNCKYNESYNRRISKSYRNKRRPR